MAHHPFDDPSAAELSEKSRPAMSSFEEALGKLMDEHDIPHLVAIYRVGSRQRRIAMAAPNRAQDVAYAQKILQIAGDAIDRQAGPTITFLPEG